MKKGINRAIITLLGILFSCLLYANDNSVYHVLPIVELSSTSAFPLKPQMIYLDEYADEDLQSMLGKTQSSDWIKVTHNNHFSDFEQVSMWFAFRLKNTHLKEQVYYLDLAAPSMLSVNVYLQSKGQSYSGDISSSFHPISSRPLSAPTHLYPIQIASGEEKVVFLKVVGSARRVVANTRIFNEKSIFSEYQLLSLLHWFYFGAILILSIYGLILYVFAREKPYLVYSLYSLCFAGFFLVNSGFGQMLFGIGTHWWSKNTDVFFLFLSAASIVLFQLWFLELKHKLPKVYWFLLLLMSVSAFMAVISLLLPVTYRHWLLLLVVLIGIPICVIGLVIACYLWHKKDITGRHYTLAWIPMLLAIIVVVLDTTELSVDLPFYPIYFVELGHIVQSLVFAVLMGENLHRLLINNQVSVYKGKMQAAFLSRMSHDVRTPLNGILGMSSLLEKRLKDPTDREYNEIIQNSGKALLNIVNDVVDYSKLESGELSLESQEFCLPDLLNEVIKLFSVRIKEKALSVQIEKAENLPEYVKGDSARLQQILLNLLSRAVHVSDEGEIVLSVRASSTEENTIHFAVIDTGKGLTEKERQGLFEPFSAISTYDSENQGRSMNLALSRRLVELMGGAMGVSSVLGKGAVFWFQLPLIKIDNPVCLISANKGKDKLASGSLAILVVEDNQVNQLVVANMLKRLGHAAVVVNNGAEALEAWTLSINAQPAKGYDLILMDCEMPVMDGFEATKKIRSYEEHHGLTPTPIVALTAHVLESDEQLCFDSGMDKILRKPITIDTLDNLLKGYM